MSTSTSSSLPVSDSGNFDFVTDRIAVGSGASALEVGALLDVGVEAVLNVANDLVYNRPTDKILYGMSPLIDGPGNHVYDLVRASMILSDLLRARKGAVLVHCREGVSRSPIVVATYLVMLDKDWPHRSIDRTLSDLSMRRGKIDPRQSMIALAEAAVLTGEGKTKEARRFIMQQEYADA